MNEKTTFTIEEELLGAAGAILPVEKSPLSLLRETKNPVPGDASARMQAAGITESSGRIRQEYLRAFGVLAQARSFARLKFSAGDKIFEFLVYFPADASAPVSLLHNGNNLVVEDPAGIDQAFMLIDQHIGHSLLSSQTFKGEFSREEALALFALMDLERKTLIHGIADNTEPRNAVFDLATIMGQVKNPYRNFQSLEFVLQSRIIPGDPLTPDRIGQGLAGLAGKGLIQQNDSGFMLGDGLYQIASRFLIMDSFVILESARLDQNNTMWGGSFLSLQAGVNDVLYLEGHAEEIIVRCITAGELMELANSILSDPSFIPVTPEVPAQQAGASPARRHCTQCGAEIADGKKFCGKCGARVS